MSKNDYVIESEQALADALGQVVRPTATQLLTIASVNATLAVAAEQRTANAIAALKLSSADLEVKDPMTSKIEAGQERIRRRNSLVEIVREGLGQA